MNYPNSLKNLIESFKLLPGIGEKTAERLSLAVLALDEEKTQKFSNSINDVKTKIKRCPICHTLTEDEICNICKDDCRNTSILCVVEQPKDVILFENIGTFTGRYHVLDGLISPLDGVNPEKICGAFRFLIYDERSNVCTYGLFDTSLYEWIIGDNIWKKICETYHIYLYPLLYS